MSNKQIQRTQITALSVMPGCTKEGAGVPNIATDDFENVAYEFTIALTNRDYKKPTL